VQYRWAPGQSGNPAGHSRGRRFTNGILDLITEKSADREIAKVWLREVLAGNRHYFKMLLDRVEGPVHLGETDLLPPGDEDALSIDPPVIERIMMAACPDLPNFEEYDNDQKTNGRADSP
jgi:hypothetical protein